MRQTTVFYFLNNHDIILADAKRLDEQLGFCIRTNQNALEASIRKDAGRFKAEVLGAFPALNLNGAAAGLGGFSVSVVLDAQAPNPLEDLPKSWENYTQDPSCSPNDSDSRVDRD